MKKDITLEKREVFTPGREWRCARVVGNIIEGVAIVTNKETGPVWRSRTGEKLKLIDPSCLNEAFIRDGYNPQPIVTEHQALREQARWIPRRRLALKADVPDCDLGKRAKALIANGTYTGCSFEFWAKGLHERRGVDGKDWVCHPSHSL